MVTQGYTRFNTVTHGYTMVTLWLNTVIVHLKISEYGSPVTYGTLLTVETKLPQPGPRRSEKFNKISQQSVYFLTHLSMLIIIIKNSR